MTTKPLSAARRKKVAEACTGESCEKRYEYIWIKGLENPAAIIWDPNAYHWKALTRTTARLIEELPDETTEQQCRYVEMAYRFIKALAADDVPALEQLCAEMLEAVDDKA